MPASKNSTPRPAPAAGPRYNDIPTALTHARNAAIATSRAAALAARVALHADGEIDGYINDMTPARRIEVVADAIKSATAAAVTAQRAAAAANMAATTPTLNDAARSAANAAVNALGTAILADRAHSRNDNLTAALFTAVCAQNTYCAAYSLADSTGWPCPAITSMRLRTRGMIMDDKIRTRMLCDVPDHSRGLKTIRLIQILLEPDTHIPRHRLAGLLSYYANVSYDSARSHVAKYTAAITKHGI
jgi:hypothetical protein